MIAEKEFINEEQILDLEEPETVQKELVIEKIYEVLKRENLYEIFPYYDLKDIKLTQEVVEIYKTIFWGITALASTLLWLYFFLT